MAIDTEGKRRSALRMALPVPDSLVNARDRAQVIWNYSGLAAIVISVGPVISAIRNLVPQVDAITDIEPDEDALTDLEPDTEDVEEF